MVKCILAISNNKQLLVLGNCNSIFHMATTTRVAAGGFSECDEPFGPVDIVHVAVRQE